MKGHQPFNLHNLLNNPYITGDYDMMINTSFNIIYNADHCDQINVGDRQAEENMTRSLQSETTNKTPAPHIQPKAESAIVQNLNTECKNTTLIPTKLNLTKYQLGMHHDSSMIRENILSSIIIPEFSYGSTYIQNLSRHAIKEFKSNGESEIHFVILLRKR